MMKLYAFLLYCFSEVVVLSHLPFSSFKDLMAFRLMVLHLEDGDQHQHDVSKRSGTELPRLQQEAVYVR